MLQKEIITSRLTGVTKEVVRDVSESEVFKTFETPIEPTLEEKYEELQSLVAELLEVLNG